VSNYFSRDAFVNRIRELRASGLSSKQIAGQFGVSYQTVDRWIRGEVNLKNFPVDTYRAVMGDPHTAGRPTQLVHEDRPPYGLKREIADELESPVRMLAFIRERNATQWEALKLIIASIYRDITRGKRGMRQASEG